MENQNFLDLLTVPTQSNGKISFVEKVKQIRKRTSSSNYGMRYMPQIDAETLTLKQNFILSKSFLDTNNENSFWTIAKNSLTNEVYLIQSLDGLHKTYVKLWQGVNKSRKRTSEALYKLLESAKMVDGSDEIVDFDLVEKTDISGISPQLKVYSVVLKTYGEVENSVEQTEETLEVEETV